MNETEAHKDVNLLPDFGLFEASHMACPILPQYHPKQLMELLNSGKIRWVKAILAHLVRCIGGGSGSRYKTSTMGSFNDDCEKRSPRYDHLNYEPLRVSNLNTVDLVSFLPLIEIEN